MAEIATETQSGRHNNGMTHRKKVSIKIDLTPMVDLGFLLITFFIISTNLSKPKVIKLSMPANGDSTMLGKGAALTLLAGMDNKIFYYQGTLDESIHDGTFGITGYALSSGIGDVIRKKQTAMDKYYKGGRKELMLLIKPTKDASYENVIKLLDETLINRVEKYALTDVTAQETSILHTYKVILPR